MSRKSNLIHKVLHEDEDSYELETVERIPRKPKAEDYKPKDKSRIRTNRHEDFS